MLIVNLVPKIWIEHQYAYCLVADQKKFFPTPVVLLYMYVDMHARVLMHGGRYA